MDNGIINIKQEINNIPQFKEITVIGDPGCDGLGAGTMSIFAKALTCLHSDFTIIVGDIVHKGIKPLYKSVVDFANAVSLNNVYMLCGNHDTAYYEDYFGLRNYILYNENTLLIFLDDSKRSFEEQTIDFLSKVLKDYDRENIVLFFHIPPPNTIGTNTINQTEWEKVVKVIENYKVHIKYIICGHVHSYYEDSVDGIKLIVTGGGGARIEYVNEKIDKLKAHHHIVKLYYNSDNILLHEHISLQDVMFKKELLDNKLKEYLEKALTNEAIAHVKYKLFASDAEEKGFIGLAKMFRAFADAEFYHARNHFYVLNKMESIEKNLKNSNENETYEIDVMYKDFLEYSLSQKHGLASYTFFDALEAEKIHQKLVCEAIESFNNNKDVADDTYYTCSSCGQTFKGIKPQNCHICGAPSDKIFEVK